MPGPVRWGRCGKCITLACSFPSSSLHSGSTPAKTGHHCASAAGGWQHDTIPVSRGFSRTSLRLRPQGQECHSQCIKLYFMNKHVRVPRSVGVLVMHTQLVIFLWQWTPCLSSSRPWQALRWRRPAVGMEAASLFEVSKIQGLFLPLKNQHFAMVVPTSTVPVQGVWGAFHDTTVSLGKCVHLQACSIRQPAITAQA